MKTNTLSEHNNLQIENETGTSPKKHVMFKIGKYIAYAIFLIIVIVLLLGSFIFLRHRQLCSYQPLVQQSKVIQKSDQELCPNLLASDKWGQILKNSFNFNVVAGLNVNPKYDSTSLTTEQQKDKSCEDPLDPVCWVSGNKPDLKQTNGFTNVFIAGTDSNNAERSNLQNTDTMMLISLNHNTGDLLYISFPRDLYVDYERPNGLDVSYKLNAVHAIDGVEGLNGVIEQITNKPIHYYAYVNLDIFTKIIDKLGGVTITLEEKFEDRYPCAEVPSNRECKNVAYMGGAYGLFEFPKGENTFDSFEALVYSRARKLSSDYERAGRQQKLVNAVLKQAINNDKPITEKAKLYLDLYKIFKDEVKTNVQLKDAAGLLSIFDDLNTDAAKVVVDTELKNGELVEHLGILPKVGWSIGFTDRSYQDFRNYINQIWNYLPYYVERPKIHIINARTDKIPENHPLQKYLTGKIPYVEVKQTSTETNYSGTRIYDLSNGQMRNVVKDIKSRLPNALLYNAAIEGITQSEFKEDIVVIFGEK